MRTGGLWVLLLVQGCSRAPEPASAPASAVDIPGSTASALPPASAAPAAVIPNTGVPDSEENRAVLAFCERFRRAMEKRDLATLLSMISPRYRDQGARGMEDVTYEDVKRTLERQRTEGEIRLEFRYQEVKREGALVRVSYTYSASFMVGGKWLSRTDSAVFEIEHRGGSFAFLSGI